LFEIAGPRIAGGFIGFGILAMFGLSLLVRGIRDDIYDWLGNAPASRSWFIFAGVLFQVPLIAWILFLVHQGWFRA
jgi:hypothetical protein